jgi:hypothetical protein
MEPLPPMDLFLLSLQGEPSPAPKESDQRLEDMSKVSMRSSMRIKARAIWLGLFG